MKKKWKILLLATTFIIYQMGCSKDQQTNTATVQTYVIVPGAWSAPYAWQNVKSQLEQQGQKVIVVQLPGHGTDETTVYKTLTLDKYRDYVIGIIDSLNTRVILVGHSMAGMVISEVAEKIPAKIIKMIYVGAYLPVSGQSLLDLALSDTISLLPPALRPNKAFDSLDIERASITDIFIQDGSETIKQLLLSNYKIEPGPPFLDKATLTAHNFGAVDKYYVHTLQDHLIPLSLQNNMVSAAGISKIFQINSSHSPFLARPDSLAILLQKIVAE